MSNRDEMFSPLSFTSRPNLKRKCKNSEAAQSMTAPKRCQKHVSLVPEKNKIKKQETLLTDLPNEILFKILEDFSFDDLFKLECVDKRHRDVLRRVIWPTKRTLNQETIDKYSETRHKITNKSIKAVLSRSNILHVDLSSYCWTITNEICSFLSMVPQLLTLNLSFIKLNKKNLVEISRHCTLLEEISFVDSFDDEECDDGLKQIFIKCPNLKYLNIADCCPIKGKSFAYISNNLKYLNLTYCFDIIPQAWKWLSERAKNLETLILDQNEDIPNLNLLLNSFPKLRFVELSNVGHTKGGKILDFSNMKELEMLSLKDSHYLTIPILQSLQNCPKLKMLELKLEYGSRLKVFETLKHFKSLKYCKLNYFKNFKKLIEFIQSTQLEYLSLYECERLNKDIVKSLLTECASLTHLEFRATGPLNYKSISKILSGNCPHKQKSLH